MDWLTALIDDLCTVVFGSDVAQSDSVGDDDADDDGRSGDDGYYSCRSGCC